MPQPKVFGIGFHKTGTTSLGAAFDHLGYRVCGVVGNREVLSREDALGVALPLVPRFDAFQDNPWALLYRELDEAFPGSKFVLTLRDEDAWLRSVVKHFGGRSTAMREWIYGVGDPLGSESVYVERYRRHNREVRAYFERRPDDLLVLETGDPRAWEKLSGFLGKPTPEVPFPHLNRAESRGALQSFVTGARTIARRIVDRLVG